MSASRRNFLRESAFVAVAGCLPSAALALAPDQFATGVRLGTTNVIHLGLASYTLRSFTRAQVIAAMKSLNLARLNCKDVKDHLPMTPAEAVPTALAEYAAAGITVTAVGTVSFSKPEDFRKNFAYAKAAGVKVIVAGGPAPASLPAIEALVKEYDIRFAIHNHGPEDKLWPSPLTVLEAVKDLDPRMGCCVDVGHTMRSGTDVVDALHQVGPRLFDVHMKDLAQASNKESQVAVGKGVMPVREIFLALSRIKYTGNVDLEYEIFPEDPMPGVTESFAFMRKVIAETFGYKA